MPIRSRPTFSLAVRGLLVLSCGMAALPVRAQGTPAFSDEFSRRVTRVMTSIEKFYAKPVIETMLFSGCAAHMAYARFNDQPLQQRFRSALADLRQPARRDVERVIGQLDGNRLRSWEMTDLIDRCSAGMVAASGAHNQYFSPSVSGLMRRRDAGELGDVELVIATIAKAPVIVWLLPDSPGYLAGLRAGDEVLEIDGKPAREQDPVSLRYLLVGSAGSEVSLTVRHEGQREPARISVTRSLTRLHPPQIERLPDNILLITLPEIAPDTLDHLANALQQQDAQGGRPRGVVLDLRDNDGGPLPFVVGVAAAFVGQQAVIGEALHLPSGKRFPLSAQVVFAGHAERAASLMRLPAWTQQVPLAVLTSPVTANGGELIAAGLQDQRQAVVIGPLSSGRAFLRSQIDLGDLGDRAGLSLVSGLLYRGSGASARPLDGVGVEPDVQIAFTAGSTAPTRTSPQQDQVLAKALRVLLAQDRKQQSR